MKKLLKDKKNLITFITAGDPDLKTTEKLIYEIEKSGADLIELGLPFSDSIADGPTIQASFERALKNKVNLSDVLSLVKRVKAKIKIPIVLMGSYTLIFRYGIVKFCQDAKKAEVAGLIIPDLPVEESSELKKETGKNKLDLIFLISPVSSEKRIKAAVKNSSGFLYLISLLGITGARKALPKSLKGLVKKVKDKTDLPVAVGFGISTPTQVKEVLKLADGVIVGSAIVKIIEKYKKGAVKRVGQFVESLKKATW